MTEQPEQTERGHQATLFELGKGGKILPQVATIAPLAEDSPLVVARYWFRRHLEQGGHSHNTIESYSYDLAAFEAQTRVTTINKLRDRDVARFLGDKEISRSTRKRRLTSLSSFFKFLVGSARVLHADPTENFYPDPIPLHTPRPLFAEEQERLLAAAAADSPRAHAAIWLMLRLGLSRGELVTLRAEDVDLSDEHRPVVNIYYEQPRWAGKERRLAAAGEFTAIYRQLLASEELGSKLFPILPQSVNVIVTRVVDAAGINREARKITPQTLRDTYAVNAAREGADENRLLALLGLADDPRNRHSVGRYLKLGAEPL